MLGKRVWGSGRGVIAAGVVLAGTCGAQDDPSVDPTPSPTPDVSSALSSQTLQGALLVVTSKEGSGSGFVAKLGELEYLITNAHVIAGASRLDMKLLSGEALAPGKGRLAVGHDVATFETTSAPMSLEVSTQVGRDVSIGDEVVIYGNSQGASVVTELRGTVKGIGPNEVEVDAPFVPGNSGSPIIHLKTGKVIGIASYIRTQKADELSKDSGINEVRRFGYRLDTITQWQDLDWAVFQREAALVHGVEEFTDDYYDFWKYVEKTKPSAFEINSRNPRLQRRIRDFQGGLNRKISEADFDKALTGFFRSLRMEAQVEYLPGRPAPTYWLTRKVWDEQKIAREEISNDLKDDIQQRQTRSN